jgi:hypothetical protein
MASLASSIQVSEKAAGTEIVAAHAHRVHKKLRDR